MGWYGDAKDWVGDKAGQAWDKFGSATDRDQGGYRDKLGGVGGDAQGFANESRGGVQRLGLEAQAERDYLRKVARGEISVSAGQLRNSLQQNVAAQRSAAAGARPGNAAMAARTAAMQAGMQGAGLAGQQATAGINERAAAHAGLSGMILNQRGQDLRGTLGGYGAAAGAYGGAYSGSMNTPTGLERALGFAKEVGKGYAKTQGAPV